MHNPDAFVLDFVDSYLELGGADWRSREVFFWPFSS